MTRIADLAKHFRENPITQRHQRPVFVIGCHRSGTNLLYDTLLSSGGFAIYRGYLPVYKMLIPKFGDPADPQNLQNMLSAWLKSNAFQKSELDAQELTEEMIRRCRTGGDFIRIVMEAISRKQGATRWAVYDPDNLLYLARIRAELPDALFVHIIRDGRDIALSLKKMGGFRPFPWNRSVRSLRETAIYWEWMVEKGRSYGARIPQDYIEVRYESLIQDPRETLKSLGIFLDHDLDYDRIRRQGQGTLAESNSSFREEGPQGDGTVNRWKQRLAADEVAGIEALVGNCLQSLGYPLESPAGAKQSIQDRMMKELYQQFLDAKVWLKGSTPLGRFTTLEPLGLDQPAEADQR